MLPLVSGSGTELDAMLACAWRDEYISKTVSRRNLSAPWNVINETEIGQSLCLPIGMVTCQWNARQKYQVYQAMETKTYRQKLKRETATHLTAPRHTSNA